MCGNLIRDQPQRVKLEDNESSVCHALTFSPCPPKAGDSKLPMGSTRGVGHPLPCVRPLSMLLLLGEARWWRDVVPGLGVLSPASDKSENLGLENQRVVAGAREGTGRPAGGPLLLAPSCRCLGSGPSLRLPTVCGRQLGPPALSFQTLTR